VVVLLARELLLVGLLGVLKRHGYLALPVHFVGKAATFCLLYAFPLLLLADGTGTVAAVARAVGWGFAWWGVGLYWVAGVMYVVQTVTVARTSRPGVAA
jgi:cardiolipin synthase